MILVSNSIIDVYKSIIKKNVERDFVPFDFSVDASFIEHFQYW